MTKPEFHALVTWLRDRWPTTRHWDHAAAVFYDFSTLDPTTVRQVAESHYASESKFGPTFAELRGATLQRTRAIGHTSDQATPCARHTWGIVDESTTPDGTTTRLGVCAVCHLEQTFPAAELQTPMEQADTTKRTEPTW